MTLPLLLAAVSCNGSADSASAAATVQDSVEAPGIVSAEAAKDSADTLLFSRKVSPDSANAVASSFRAASAALLSAYPDFIVALEDNYVCFADGSRLPYDDGRVKDFDTLLDDGDIEDMFFIPYNSASTPPSYLHDAGRSRNEPLFKKMYGNSPAAVKNNLVKVDWFGQKVDFSRVNGAADSLAKVAAEIANYPELRKYIASSGTFYWRPVRGAKRLSAHSYGIAFDIAVPYSDYWLWKNKGASETDRIVYANRFPRRLVEIFERHGFIWGGAWYHYDTMHFEFRPEIIAYSENLREE